MTEQERSTRCPAGVLTVGGRWKLSIGYHLLSGTKRFGELQRLIPAASRQMLTIQLRELEQMGVIHRHVSTQGSLKVEYSLTELGYSFEPVLRQLRAWYESNSEQMGLESLQLTTSTEALTTTHFSRESKPDRERFPKESESHAERAEDLHGRV